MICLFLRPVLGQLSHAVSSTTYDQPDVILAAHVGGNGLVRCVTSQGWNSFQMKLLHLGKQDNFVQPKGL